MRNLVFMAVVGLVVLLLSACALSEESGPTPVSVTLAPTPPLVFSGTCQDTNELEDWLERSHFSRLGFVEVLDGLSGQDRVDLQDDVNRMIDLRNQLNNFPAPDCAAQAQAILSGAMTITIDAYQTYINGDSVDLSAQVAQARTELERFNTLHLELVARFEIQIQTPAAP